MSEFESSWISSSLSLLLRAKEISVGASLPSISSNASRLE